MINSRKIRQVLTITAGLALVVTTLVLAAPAAAGPGGSLTHGVFKRLAASPGQGVDISGQAGMARTRSKTIAKLYVTGLKPNTTYPAYVHNKPCNVDNGGGHYQNVVGGPANSTNEIWLGFTTNGNGLGVGLAKKDFVARPEAQSIVIHDVKGVALACADLK